MVEAAVGNREASQTLAACRASYPYPFPCLAAYPFPCLAAYPFPYPYLEAYPSAGRTFQVVEEAFPSAEGWRWENVIRARSSDHIHSSRPGLNIAPLLGCWEHLTGNAWGGGGIMPIGKPGADIG